MQKINLLKNKSGSAIIETVIVIGLTLPIFLSFIFGGYSYYLAQSKNINLNFEVGRYASTMGACSAEDMSTIAKVNKYGLYNLNLNIDGNMVCLNCAGNPFDAPTPTGNNGTVIITCQSDNWATGSEFGVSSEYIYEKGMGNFSFYPEKSVEGATYVVE